MYRVFDLVSGLDDFVSYGRADKLAAYYKEDVLFQKLEEMGKTFLLCHPVMMLESLRAVVNELDNRTANYSDAMKNYVVDEVRRDLSELSLQKDSPLEDYLIPMIRWCIQKNLLQQALTLYAEKMPVLIVKKKILYFDEEVGGQESDIIRDLRRNRSKWGKYPLEYQFIQQYLKLSGRHGYLDKVGVQWDESKEHQKNFLEIIKIGMMNHERGLRTNWPESDNLKRIAEILGQHYSLKKMRDKMNHASTDNTHANNNVKEINVTTIIEEINKGIEGIEKLLSLQSVRI
jgi:hypothetical protein